MFKNCTVINKKTGEIFQGQVDTELQNLEEYEYREATKEEIDKRKLTQEKNTSNKIAKEYLASTDWLVIRHRDQLAMGQKTNLSNDDFFDLLEERQKARDSVLKN